MTVSTIVCIIKPFLDTVITIHLLAMRAHYRISTFFETDLAGDGFREFGDFALFELFIESCLATNDGNRLELLGLIGADCGGVLDRYCGDVLLGVHGSGNIISLNWNVIFGKDKQLVLIINILIIVVIV